jgi:hypothetical protein
MTRPDLVVDLRRRILEWEQDVDTEAKKQP